MLPDGLGKKTLIELLSCLKPNVICNIGHAKWSHHLSNEVQQERNYGQLPQGGTDSSAGVKRFIFNQVDNPLHCAMGITPGININHCNY